VSLDLISGQAIKHYKVVYCLVLKIYT